MKKILISIAFFVCIVLVCRHIVADNQQEERIVVLENAIDELLLRQAESSKQEAKDVSVRSETVPSTPKQQRYVRQNAFVKNETKKSEHVEWQDDTRQDDSRQKVSRQKDERKFSNPIVLELNTIDSATLTKVPGIAEKTAAIILKYRTQLGGFYTPYQLGERLTWDDAQERLDEWCNSWFKADEDFIKKLNVNRADFKELLRHPYLNYEQTKAVVNYRDKHHIENIAALRMLEPFTEEDIDRLQYYLSFE